MTQRARITIRGAVQGVGFRPCVYRLATEIGLAGWVLNSAQGVFIELEGRKAELDQFLLRLDRERPPRASIQSLECSWLDPVGLTGFVIKDSRADGDPSTLVLPDIATCEACMREILDPYSRYYRYPFTNCTNCGPRFSIIEALPYDRSHTSMHAFTMCPACRREYEDPSNRRFHAQPTACPACGPQLELWGPDGTVRSRGNEALVETAFEIRSGSIVAAKGIGGFHLIVDAWNEAAVVRLRQRKHREEKPLALMYPTLELVRMHCQASALEERLLTSPESPIVLVRRRPSQHSAVAPSVAPHNPFLGVMLPYTPLHHLLMRELVGPVVATSGNLSDEPICKDETEALARLRGIADVFLVHNRPIVQHVDDSIVRVMLGRELVLRRARGYAPLPISVQRLAAPVLAVGGHLKNTVGLAVGTNVFLSQHVGDLETRGASDAFREVIRSLRALYRAVPTVIAADLHPDYVSTKYAQEQGVPVVGVQHHYAHVLACMAENDLSGPVLGVSWDGTGYGLDGTIWGGEFLLTTDTGFERVATLRSFPLPGGERAIREPRRAALGLLYELWGATVVERDDLAPIRALNDGKMGVLLQMLQKGLNAPRTSSAGRLFDVVASLTGLRHINSFEGQAAMELECAVADAEEGVYPFDLHKRDALSGEGQPPHPITVVDWGPLVEWVMQETAGGVPLGTIAARFHNTLADIIVAVATRVGKKKVVLTGGCFQNQRLTEQAVRRLEMTGLQPYWHQRVPPNDGGLALGQAVAVMRSS